MLERYGRECTSDNICATICQRHRKEILLKTSTAVRTYVYIGDFNGPPSQFVTYHLDRIAKTKTGARMF